MIPRLIHQMWVGPPLPDLYAEWIEGWRTAHPGWEHVLWTDDNMPALINQSLYDNARRIAPRAPEQFQSDVARYELLQRFGGVWLDADFKCLKPIDDLMDEPWLITEGRWVANGAMALPPDHPLMADVIRRLPSNVKRLEGRRRTSNTHRSGPQFFTPIARKYGIRELPQHWFLPYLWTELDAHGRDFPDSYAVHAWNNRRRLSNQPL